MILLWLVLGCSQAPTDALTWREAWEVLIATEDGGIIDAHASIGNSGMMRGEGRVHIDWWASGETPILYTIEGGPNDIDVSDARDAVRVGTALVGRYEEGDHWTVRAASDGANAILRINPGGIAPPMATALVGGGQWTISAPMTLGTAHGWYTAGKRGGMLQGRSVVLHRGGDGQPNGPRKGLFILGNEASIGIDQQGDLQLAWANIGGQDFDLTEVKLTTSANGEVQFDLRPAQALQVRVKPLPVGGMRDGHEHLLAPEQWAARSWGRGARRQIQRGIATISMNDREFRSPAILLSVE